MGRKNTHFIQSLARGLNVLQAFSAEEPALTLTGIVRKTGLNHAAAQRYTDTLVALGFLKRNKHREFLLGPKVLSLGFAFLGGNHIRKLAEVYISECSERLNKTMNLAVLEGAEVFFIYRREAQRFLSFDLHAGSKLPAHCTATGKVLLAGLPDARLKEVIRGIQFERITSHTILDPDQLWEDLMVTRRRGYSVCDRELYLDLYSLGVPLVTGEGRVAAAVNLSLSAERSDRELRRRMLEELVALGRTLSAALGYERDYPVIPVADEDTP